MWHAAAAPLLVAARIVRFLQGQAIAVHDLDLQVQVRSRVSGEGLRDAALLLAAARVAGLLQGQVSTVLTCRHKVEAEM